MGQPKGEGHMGLGLLKAGVPWMEYSWNKKSILVLVGLGLVPGLDFLGLGCRSTSRIIDALVWEYALVSRLKSGHLEGIWKESGFLEGILDPGLSYKIQ